MVGQKRTVSVRDITHDMMVLHEKFMEKCESLIKCSGIILLYGSSVMQVKPFIFYLCSYDFALSLSKPGFGGLKSQPFKIGSIVSALK